MTNRTKRYAVSIRYPRKEGREFNFEHWVGVHMPLGVATLRKTNGIAPLKVMVQHETFGIDGRACTADSYVTVWLIFDTAAGLDAFMTLHTDPVASAALEKDFGNYAPLPPQIVLGAVTIFEDVDAVLERGDTLLATQ